MMFFPVTTLTAGVLGFWFFILSYRVIRARQTASQTENGIDIRERRVRGHGNFSEYVPIMLVLCATLEYSSAMPYVLWAGAGMLVMGRLLHGYAFAFMDHWVLGRSAGTGLTLLSLLILSLANIAVALNLF